MFENISIQAISDLRDFQLDPIYKYANR